MFSNPKDHREGILGSAELFFTDFSLVLSMTDVTDPADDKSSRVR